VEFEIELTVSTATILGKPYFYSFIKDISWIKWKNGNEQKRRIDWSVKMNWKLILENIMRNNCYRHPKRRIVLSNRWLNIGINKDSEMPAPPLSSQIYLYSRRKPFLPPEPALEGNKRRINYDVEIIIETQQQKKKRLLLAESDS
jgi:hypothetical protein